MFTSLVTVPQTLQGWIPVGKNHSIKAVFEFNDST